MIEHNPKRFSHLRLTYQGQNAVNQVATGNSDVIRDLCGQEPLRVEGYIGIDSEEILQSNIDQFSKPIPLTGGLGMGIAMPDPDTLESTIVDAVGDDTLSGESIAARCSAPYNSNFKTTLSGLRKRGFLHNKSPGYCQSDAYKHFKSHGPDSGQDKRQD